MGQKKATSTSEISEDPLTLGLSLRGDNLGIEDFFWGMMSDVRIWHIARTQKEIQFNMSKQLEGTETGLVANWKMDEGNGQIVNDIANNLDGHLGSTIETDENDPIWIKTRFPERK